MTKQKLPLVEVQLEAIVGGGQALGTLEDGRKVFVWGGLPGELVQVQLTKKKSRMAEGFVVNVLKASPQRVQPRDPESYLSTSPWQIMSLATEQTYKEQLIDEAFTMHGVTLPGKTEVYTDGHEYAYRNKVEFSWYGQFDETTGRETLDLAFFRRGGKGKVTVNDCALLPEPILVLARAIRDHLQKLQVNARVLKTLLIRCDAQGNCVWQLYTKEPTFKYLLQDEAAFFPAQGGEVIYSDPRSPASVITKRLFSVGNTTLTDTIHGIPFCYAAESFFQVNVPVYEHALRDMSAYIPKLSTVVDLYSGVGTIGLTIGGTNTTLVEVNEYAVREMKRNIEALGVQATAVLAASESALTYITSDKTIIVDPPRAGLHDAVVERLLNERPKRIIYLSCNPVTQARDVAKLQDAYTIVTHSGYNFFPHTPHIEHMVVLDAK